MIEVEKYVFAMTLPENLSFIRSAASSERQDKDKL